MNELRHPIRLLIASSNKFRWIQLKRVNISGGSEDEGEWREMSLLNQLEMEFHVLVENATVSLVGSLVSNGISN